MLSSHSIGCHRWHIIGGGVMVVVVVVGTEEFKNVYSALFF